VLGGGTSQCWEGCPPNGEREFLPMKGEKEKGERVKGKR